MSRRRSERRKDPRLEAFQTAARAVFAQRMFRTMDDSSHHGRVLRSTWAEDAELGRARGWARVRPDGLITVNRNAPADPAEWMWVLAHCTLHLGFGHLEPGRIADHAAQAAACLAVTRFQQQLRIGTPPFMVPAELPGTDEERLAALWRDTGVPTEYAALGGGGASPDQDLGFAPEPEHGRWARQAAAATPPPTWSELFAVGLAAAATEAVEEAGQQRPRADGELAPDHPWEQARRWFVSSYPLLGALAAGFRIVADAELARTWQISVAAVDAEAGEIYVNPLHRMSGPERRFVLAHEMLHAALRHGQRVGPRDPYLWNVATDFVINGWLVQMGVGEMPDDVLYDPALKDHSSEEVYDLITGNLRRYRKLATLRGRGLGDMLDRPIPGAGEARRAGDVDDFCRRALLGGLAHHEQTGRGLLPAGLVAEIRVLDHPPPPWDVQLAQWFDRYFTPLEPTRSYARASRRQASTPDIPRPGRARPELVERQRTFGVVLDTSGSMSTELMGRALGAIASYALARDVPAARVVFCDAAAYDAGYLPVEDIAGRVKVRGRGGTELQPGIRLLERAEDFPADGPILIITDGDCDVLRVRREHAYLMPERARLPFTPRGEVFRLR
ncbi:vWA domain-containing protein [Catellatospora paridis]|uniref:vWA domain-containing protein n=1 Tax=Catellatospora paridis TaxID=1617086 RepID=UPI0038B3CCDF